MANWFVSKLASTLPIPHLSFKCGEFISGLVDRVYAQNLTQTDVDVMYYSGRYFGELGLYQSCISAPNMSYYNIQIGPELLRNYLGICMTNKCDDEDWIKLHTSFKELVVKGISSDPKYPPDLMEYFIVDFDKVYPRDAPGLADSYTLVFTVLFFGMIALVLYSTIYYYFKRKSGSKNDQDLNLKNESNAIQSADNPLDAERDKIVSRNVLRIFDLRTMLGDAGSYVVKHPGQMAADLCHIIYAIYAVLYVVAFGEAMLSRVIQDKVEFVYYNTGPADANLTLVLYIPEGFLFLGGYVCTLAVFRAFDRVKIGVKRQNWWRLVLCYFRMVIGRWLRLAFGMLLGSLFVWKFIPLITSGPFRFSQLGCTDDNFFTSLFFLNNDFAGVDRKMCSNWYYFFAMDFRFYITVPLIVLVYIFLSKRIAGLICIVLGTTSMVWQAIYIQKHKIREIHPYDGHLLARVFSLTYFHALSYYLGVVASMLQLNYIDGYTCSLEAKYKSAPYFNPDAGKELGSVKRSFTARKDKRIPLDPERSSVKRFWEATGIVSLLIFSTVYYIYRLYLQNDDVNIRAWPQWKHTLFNTAGIYVIGVFPMIIIFSLCFRFGRPLMPYLSNNLVFSLLRSIHYEMYLTTMPGIILLYFSLQTIVYFDEPFVNWNISWLTLFIIILSLALHLLVTRPYLTFFKKLLAV